MWLWATLQIGFAAGLATTFDDNIYLTAFFGEVNRTFRPIHVVVGELVGFTVLLAVSLIGFAVGMALPASTVGLLGILPIAIGIQNLYALIQEAITEAAGNQAKAPTPVHEKEGTFNQSGFRSRRISAWDALRDRKTYDVAAVSISNGSNNLSIYIPLFASLTPTKILVVIPVFYLFIGTWLLLSFSLTRMPGISLVLNRYAKVLFPFVLMWLGYRILSDSGAMNLMHSWA
jgi:cadmium resistance protein CadD (predicted permease)